MSSFFFEGTLKEILKELKSFIPANVTLLVYTDDLTLVGSNAEDVLRCGNMLEKHLMEYDLTLKEDKEMISSTYYDFDIDHEDGIKRNHSGTVLKFPLGDETVNIKWDETLKKMRVWIEDHLKKVKKK